MTSNLHLPSRLHLLQLASIAVRLPDGRTSEMVLGCYLVQTNQGRNFLIDTGIAPDSAARGFPRSAEESNVLDRLSVLGIKPDSIDTVICSHFDEDHIGYNDAFPNSEFIVQRAHYEMARSGHPRLAAGRHHWGHAALRYRLVDGDTELLPGLELIATPGHVTGHQSVLVRLPRTGAVLLPIDAAVVQRLFIPDRPVWPQDEDLTQLRQSTCKLIELVERDNVRLVVFGHDGIQWQALKQSPEFYD